MNRDEFRYVDRLRVRWAEIDAQKIVFNGHYLMYFDTAVAGYWRALAVPFARTMEQLGGDMYVRKATVEYEASAVYDDVLHIGVRCARVGKSSVLFSGAAFRQDKRLVTCELVYVYADPQTQTSRPVPQELRALFEGFETGRDMLDLTLGTWADLGTVAQAIRHEVFVAEQQIPAALDADEADVSAVHAVAYNRLGMPLATGRWVQQSAGVAKIGRMAVIQPLRSASVGGRVLEALVRSATEQGNQRVTLQAQIAAQAFYERAGFTARGPVFEEAGIAHVNMDRPL
jgi:YbgC/YbaW family acyl-CoA thioester hydrolase